MRRNIFHHSVEDGYMAVSTLFREEAEANTKHGYECLRNPKYKCVFEASCTVGHSFKSFFLQIIM